MLTLDEARRRVEAIRKVAHDDEVAHSQEDELREAVLRTIADPSFSNLAHAKALCALALETEQISFARWCA